MCMISEIMVVMVSFFAFAFTYIATKAHNMLVLMLNPHFKSLDVVKGFIGKEKVV